MTTHSHVFLGKDHEGSERRTWAVIWLCAVMMALEIIGGWLFGSIALIADGLHMSTHAGALLLAALAYRFARTRANDSRFSFGTGKFGDLAGYTSAIVLAMIALLIAYESVTRLLAPVPIHFAEAIPIAALGLAVNLGSAWLLAGGDHHHHGHSHDHGHGHDHPHDHDEAHRIAGPFETFVLSVFEHDHPPVFRLHTESGRPLAANAVLIETIRPGGTNQIFTFKPQNGFLQSEQTIPEPHEFTARLRIGETTYDIPFVEHVHAQAAAHRDNNMRAAIVHVAADAAVSVLVIVGLLLARSFGWLWMDPAAGLVGAVVIASWALGLVRDTGGILLDMTADPTVTDKIRQTIEAEGDTLHDLHIWRLGPGHLGAIVSVRTSQARDAAYYRAKLTPFRTLSHITIEVLT
jgi:cation diffusion facilitator family transporter